MTPWNTINSLKPAMDSGRAALRSTEEEGPDVRACKRGRGGPAGTTKGAKQQLVLATAVAPPRLSPATLVTVNGSTWTQAQVTLESLLDEGNLDDVILVQETRFTSEAARTTAGGWCRRNGLRAALGPCRRSPGGRQWFATDFARLPRLHAAAALSRPSSIFADVS